MSAALYRGDVAERRERIVELTRQGYTADQISHTEGVTARTVQRTRQAMGISRDYNRMTPDELRAAAALLDDGCSYGEVARTLGRAPCTIRRHFPGRGWPVGDVYRVAAFNRQLKQLGGTA
jgi:IS30 family transposase